jgi:hypothetical protein
VKDEPPNPPPVDVIVEKLESPPFDASGPPGELVE